jgi:hypothetical protein
MTLTCAANSTPWPCSPAEGEQVDDVEVEVGLPRVAHALEVALVQLGLRELYRNFLLYPQELVPILDQQLKDAALEWACAEENC